MDRTRVEEIIAAYGADVTRWPADERAAAQALVAQDAKLSAAFEAAAALDADLLEWARTPVLVADTAASAAADRALANASGPLRWWRVAIAGGSMAATVAALAVLLPSKTRLSEPTPVAQTAPANSTQTVQVAQDLQVWSSVFTPTPEEESVI